MFEKYDKAVSAYAKEMRRNELSRDSITSYTRTFRMLRESMERNGHDDVSAAAVLDFLNEKSEVGAKLTTIALYATHIRCLSNFAEAFRIVSEPFFLPTMTASKGKLAKERSKQYEHVLTDKDAEELINCDRPK